MKFNSSKSFRSMSVGLAGALLLGACGGTIEFQDKSALTIRGEAPEKPKVEKKRVEVKSDKIEISEKIQFAKASAEILHESDDLLDEIVQVIKDNPQIEKISIEGHTSSEGDADFNKRLSNDRAKAVLDYLVSHGVDAKRLESKGFGPDKPLAANDTEENREKNRRVEFRIIKQGMSK